MRREERGKDLGYASIQPDRDIVAGEPYDWKIIYTCGSRGISMGGAIRFEIPYGFTPPQSVYPIQIGYTTVECSNPDVQPVLSHSDPQKVCCNQGVFAVYVFVQIDGSGLRPGDTVTLHYGKGHLSRFNNIGSIARYFEGEAGFTVLVDPDGSRSARHGGFYLIDDPQPRVRIIGGKASHLYVITPSILHPGEDFYAKITARDRLENTARSFTGELDIRADNGASSHCIVKTENNGRGIIPGFRATSPGTIRVTAQSESDGLRGCSNPVLVTQDAKMPRLFWGDTHVMTEISAGLGRPASALEYARDTSYLDFCAITDGDDADGYFSDEEWEETKTAVRHYYNPGQFVTLLASEFHERRVAGDKNIYYRTDEHPLLRWSDVGGTQPESLWEALRGEKALTIPHHPVSGSAGLHPWEHYHPDFQRLVEVYSIWGNSECEGAPRPNYWHNNYNNSIQAGLARGYRMGLIASGDSHDGLPGNSSWMRLRPGHRGGLAAVYADELTRESIFDALWDRFCYGTTGARIILWYTLNGAPMGRELTGGDHRARRRIHIHAIGTAPISRIVIIRNGVEAFVHPGSGMEERIDFEDTAPYESVSLTDYEGKPFIYYYIRVEQTDGEIAWSSPVWVA